MASKNKKFLSICPRSKTYLTFNVKGIPLRVVYDDGVEFEPDIKFNKIELAGKYSLFRNQSGYNDSFKITVMIHKDDKFSGGLISKLDDVDPVYKDLQKSLTKNGSFTWIDEAKVLNGLDYLIRHGEPFYVYSNAVGLESSKQLWLVTEHKTRKQTNKDGFVYWDLTFTKYKEVTLGTFNKSTDVITKALNNKKNAKKDKTKEKKKLQNKLKKCKREVLVYSKKQKKVDCVKVMQEILYNAGCYAKNSKKKDVVDGWFGKKTAEAVKAYNKKFQGKYGLKVNSKVSKKTYQVMCGTAKQVLKSTTNLKKQVKNATSKDGIVNVNVTQSTNVISNSLGKNKQKLSTVTVKTTTLKPTKKTKKTTTTSKTSKTSTKKTSKTSKSNAKKDSKKNSKSSNKKNTKKKK